MKLNDLIEALAAEVELAQPRMAEQLEQLSCLPQEDERFVDVLADYSAQAQRMGEAAEMAGFPGLQSVCDHVLQNSLALPALEGEQRGEVIGFLRGWPELMTFYLRHIADPSAAAGLVDYLEHAPFPMEKDEALKVMHKLGGMPAQIQLPGGGDAEAVRPVLASAEDVALDVAPDTDPQLVEGFFHEAPEQARYLVGLARNLAAGQGDSSDIGAAKRVVHTLKGSGSIIGLRGLAALGHHLEDILEHFDKLGGGMAHAAAEVLLDAAYCIEQAVGYVTGSEEYPAQSQRVLQAVLDLANRIDHGESLEQSLERAPATPAPASVPVPAAPQGGVAPAAALRVSVGHIDELFRLSGEISVHGAAMEVRIKALSDRTRELMAQNLRVQKRLFELETAVDVRALTMMRARTQRTADAAFDPLEMDQYSELHGTSHALMEEAADVRAMSLRLQEEVAELGGVHTLQQRLAKDLQHMVIGTRMAPAGMLESRLQRTVRSTCQATDKQAVLDVQGGDTLVDSDVLNQLAEPLLHILRNAVDHGIEAPEARERAGKPAAGRIELRFARQGQQVVLRCRDDGAGLDLHRVRQKAVERGLVDAAQELDDEQVARLILLPGFSTRDSVSEISGRGVGLDVVNEWAAAMKGSVRVVSTHGQGCTIEMRFAASLSTQHSLVVEVEGQRLALPSLQVEQAVARGIGTFSQEGGQLVYRHGKRTLPASRLADAAALHAAGPERALEDCDAVIVRHDNAAQALAVDRLVDSRELLVKNPGAYARHVRGVAGLSILGDGSVAVSLDLAQLLGAKAGPRAEAAHAAANVAAPLAQRRVLVVDDSLSVRNSLLRLVQDAGYEGRAARDGMDAIEAMAAFRPDLLLTDLEMPNMNGVELTAHVRGRADLAGLPVIMVTSRSQEKHRRLAEQAGVSSYVTKPYSDADLLGMIRQALPA